MLLKILKQVGHATGAFYILTVLITVSIYVFTLWSKDRPGYESSMAMASFGDSMFGFIIILVIATCIIGLISDWKSTVWYVYSFFLLYFIYSIYNIGSRKKQYDDLISGKINFVRVM